MDLEIPGVALGHWTDTEARTGCSVLRLPEGTVASGEIRGGAPATREFALLDPVRTVSRLDAVVLAGGSAFGLASVDGVVAALEEEGTGFVTASGVVPIVVGMALFDLGVGSSSVRPSVASGRSALAAVSRCPESGSVGAGAGATVGKWRGPDAIRPGGLGIHVSRADELRVTAIVAVNAAGDIDDGSALTAVDNQELDWPHREPFGNTTIGVVVTNARLSKIECLIVAQGAHSGLARAIVPSHTRADGDCFVAAATGSLEADVDQVRLLAMRAVEHAIRDAVDTLDS